MWLLLLGNRTAPIVLHRCTEHIQHLRVANKFLACCEICERQLPEIKGNFIISASRCEWRRLATTQRQITFLLFDIVNRTMDIIARYSDSDLCPLLRRVIVEMPPSPTPTRPQIKTNDFAWPKLMSVDTRVSVLLLLFNQNEIYTYDVGYLYIVFKRLSIPFRLIEAMRNARFCQTHTHTLLLSARGAAPFIN